MAEIDLSDLDAFAAVANARSFRGAAALRGVAASSLSEAVRRLETRLGCQVQTSWGMTELSPLGTVSTPGETGPRASGRPPPQPSGWKRVATFRSD